MCQTSQSVPDTAAGPVPQSGDFGGETGNPSNAPAQSGDFGGETAPSVKMKTVPTKFGVFLKYAIPALQGAAYGAGTATPVRGIGASSFGASLASALGRVGAHNQQMQMLQYQMGLEGLDRQLKLATLQNTLRHQGVLEGQGQARVNQGDERVDATNRRLDLIEQKLNMPKTGDEPLDAPASAPSQGLAAPTTPGGAGGGASPAPPSPAVASGMLGGLAEPMVPSVSKNVPLMMASAQDQPGQNATAPAKQGALAPATSNSRVSQLNQGLAARYKVLNPGKDLPPEFTLPPTATQKDFDRIDKLMEATERAQGTKAQQDTVNEMRRQTQEIAKNKQDQSEQSLDVAARSIANGDLTSLKDITSMRGDQRLLLYSKIKNLNPNFDTSKLQRQIEMMDNFANKKQGDNLQSFGTFLEHAGALKDVMDGLGNTDVKILNRPLNWLRENVGNDPQIQKVLAALDPVQKEFESYLLNNRALYTSDRATVDKIISGDLPPVQLVGALQQMGHTVQARYNEANNRFKNTMNGKNIEDYFPMTEEAKDGARKIGVTVGSSGSTGSVGQLHPAAQAYISKLYGKKANAGRTATAAVGANP